MAESQFAGLARDVSAFLATSRTERAKLQGCMTRIVDVSRATEEKDYKPTYDEMTIYTEFLLFVFSEAKFLLRHATQALSKFLTTTPVIIDCLNEYEDLFVLKIHSIPFDGQYSATNLTIKLLEKGITFDKIIDAESNLYPFSARLLEAVESLPDEIVNSFKDTPEFLKMVQGIEDAAVKKVRETESHRRTGVISKVSTRQDLQLLRKIETKRQLELEMLELRIKERRGNKTPELQKSIEDVRFKLRTYGGSSNSPVEVLNIILNAARELGNVASQKLKNLSLEGRVDNQGSLTVSQIDNMQAELQVLRLNVAFMGSSRGGRTSLIWGLVGLPGLADPCMEEAQVDSAFLRAVEDANKYSRMQIMQRSGMSVCPVEYIHNASAQEPFAKPNKSFHKLLQIWVRKARSKNMDCPQSVWNSIEKLLSPEGVSGDRKVVQCLHDIQDFLLAASELEILTEIEMRTFADFGSTDASDTNENPSGWGSSPRIQVETRFAVFTSQDAFGEITLLDVPAMDNDLMCHEDTLEMHKRLVDCSEYSVFVFDAVRFTNIGMWDSRTGGPFSPECLDILSRTIASMPNGFTSETAAVVLSHADRLDKFASQIHLDAHVERMAKYIHATSSGSTMSSIALDAIRHLIQFELGRPIERKNAYMEKYVKGGPMRAPLANERLTPNERKKLAADHAHAVREKIMNQQSNNSNSTANSSGNKSDSDDDDDLEQSTGDMLTMINNARDLHESISAIYGRQFLELTAKNWWDAEDVLKRQGKRVDAFELEHSVVNEVLGWILGKAAAIPGTSINSDGLPLGGLMEVQNSKSEGGRRRTINPNQQTNGNHGTVRGRASSVRWRESFANDLENDIQNDKKRRESRRYTSSNLYKTNQGITKQNQMESVEENDSDEEYGDATSVKTSRKSKSRVGFGNNTEYDYAKSHGDNSDYDSDDGVSVVSEAPVRRKSKTGIELRAIIDSVVEGTRGNRPLISFVSGLYATLGIFGLLAVKSKAHVNVGVRPSESRKGTKKIRFDNFATNVLQFPWLGKLLEACEGVSFMRRSVMGIAPSRLASAVREVGGVSRVLKGLLGCTLRSKCDQLVGAKVEGTLALLQEHLGLLENSLLDLTTGGSAELLTSWDPAVFQNQLSDKLIQMFKRLKIFMSESDTYAPDSSNIAEDSEYVLKMSQRVSDDTAVFTGAMPQDITVFLQNSLSKVILEKWVTRWSEGEASRLHWLKSASKEMQTSIDNALISVSADVSLRQRVMQRIIPAIDAVDNMADKVGPITLNKIPSIIKQHFNSIKSVAEGRGGGFFSGSGPKTYYITPKDISTMLLHLRQIFLTEIQAADQRMSDAGTLWNSCAKECIEKICRASDRAKKSGEVMKKGWQQVQNYDGYVIEVVGPKGVRINLAFARKLLKGIERIMDVDPAELLSGLHAGNASECVLIANQIADGVRSCAKEAQNLP